MRKGKKIEVYLPDNHPIFLIPPGKRSRKVREALELNVWVKEQYQAIVTKLEDISNRLERIEGIIVSSHIEKKDHIQNQKTASFDMDAFTDI